MTLLQTRRIQLCVKLLLRIRNDSDTAQCNEEGNTFDGDFDDIFEDGAFCRFYIPEQKISDDKSDTVRSNENDAQGIWQPVLVQYLFLQNLLFNLWTTGKQCFGAMKFSASIKKIQPSQVFILSPIELSYVPSRRTHIFPNRENCTMSLWEMTCREKNESLVRLAMAYRSLTESDDPGMNTACPLVEFIRIINNVDARLLRCEMMTRKPERSMWLDWPLKLELCNLSTLLVLKPYPFHIEL
eukprot:IDg11586t1